MQKKNKTKKGKKCFSKITNWGWLGQGTLTEVEGSVQ